MWLLTFFACSPPDVPLITACDEGVAPGDCAPDFTAFDREWRPYSLSDFEGFVVLLDFSALWCVNCQAMAQGLEDVFHARADEGFVVVTVIIQGEDHEVATPADAAYWAESFGLSSPVLADVNSESAVPYAPLEGVPASWLLDRDGEIAWSARGRVSPENIVEQVDAVLSPNPVD